MAAKVFEVGDVLPATTQLKLTNANESIINRGGAGKIKTNAGSFTLVDYFVDFDENLNFIIDGVNIFSSWSGHLIIDTSGWSIEKRTISNVTGIFTNLYCLMYWEDLNSPQGFTITFNSNGGTTITDLTEQTTLPTPLPTPTKSGYTFVNWYYESNFQTRAKAGDTIEANTTLYAKWHNLGSLFTEIANAIRSKDGTSENIRDLDFDDRIKGLDTCIYLTQEEYDLLDPPNENITYIIVEVE